MAQTGFTPISNYYSATATNVPTAGNLVAGELAINTADGKLFYKDSAGVVQTMASKATTAGTYSSITTNNLTIGTTQLGAGDASIMKNRIINGAMVISQRNGTSSVTPASGDYTLDRYQYVGSQASKFTVQQNAGSITPPVGFANYLGATVASAATIGSGDYFYISQKIEGYNIADLNWGTVNAKTVTLSFQVYSSLTGTFGGALQNSSSARCYPFSYTVSSANTWTTVSITIAGDTTGTWQTTTSSGIQVIFSLGMGSTYSGTAGAWTASNVASATGAISVVGTANATFYITGVQLEVGSSATGFEYVNYQTSLANCQRYAQMLVTSAYAGNTYAPIGIGVLYNTTTGTFTFGMPAPMRSIPSLTTVGTIFAQNQGINVSSFSVSGPNTTTGGYSNLFDCDFTLASSTTAGSAAMIRFNNAATRTFLLTAEL